MEGEKQRVWIGSERPMMKLWGRYENWKWFVVTFLVVIITTNTKIHSKQFGSQKTKQRGFGVGPQKNY